MATTINWVLDGNSKYEISSKEHFHQLMHESTLYTDSGFPPSNCWSSEYIQTVDIDLINDSTHTKPIGQFNDTVGQQLFLGEYDGDNCTISNWSYNDPASLTENTDWFVGLFGYVRFGGGLKNIRMAGICTLDGFRDQADMVAGTLGETQSSNIECDFAPGPYLVGGKSGGGSGGVIGYIRVSPIVDVTLRGTIDLVGTDVVCGDVLQARGGVFGVLASPGTFDRIQKFATFPNGIQGTLTGGLIGNFSNNVGLTNCFNAMAGDIISTGATGGICGQISQSAASGLFNSIVNAMTGDITNTNGQSSGGIIGYAQSANIACAETMNYMTGDISSTNITQEGGFIGSMVSNVSITNFINAMNGTVTNSLVGSGTSSTMDVTIDTNFGLSYTNSTYGTTTALTGYLTDPTFADLPYVDMSGMDTHGNVYKFYFVFANLAGNPSYSDYTHFSLHKGNIYSPFYADFDVPDTNTTTYLTYGNTVDKSLLTGGSFTVLASYADVVYDISGNALFGTAPSVLTLTPGPINMNVDIIEPVAGAIAYKLSHQSPTGTKNTAYVGFTSLARKIRSLSPGTEYIIRFYVNSGTGYMLRETHTVTTLSNTIGNYRVNDFDNGRGGFDVSSFKSQTLALIDEVMNDLFATGDNIDMPLPNGKSVRTTFVKRGGTTAIGNKDVSITVPFTASAGAGQNATLTLSDSSSVVVSYDESTKETSISGQAYSTGEYLIIEGKKVTIYSL